MQRCNPNIAIMSGNSWSPQLVARLWGASGFIRSKQTDGSVERYKARLVNRGFAQQYGSDYDETFSPVARLESLWVLIALSVQNGLKLNQVDVVTAFLNGNLEEEVYMSQPEGYVNEREKHLVCKLKRSIYIWAETITQVLELFSRFSTEVNSVYIDDILLAGKLDKRIKKVN